VIRPPPIKVGWRVGCGLKNQWMHASVTYPTKEENHIFLSLRSNFLLVVSLICPSWNHGGISYSYPVSSFLLYNDVLGKFEIPGSDCALLFWTKISLKWLHFLTTICLNLWDLPKLDNFLRNCFSYWNVYQIDPQSPRHLLVLHL
jgi:hypothetical protein